MEINIHNPVRRTEESQSEYKSRLGESHRVSTRNTRVAYKAAAPEKSARRTLVGAVGVRQAKKALRKARAK